MASGSFILHMCIFPSLETGNRNGSDSFMRFGPSLEAVRVTKVLHDPRPQVGHSLMLSCSSRSRGANGIGLRFVTCQNWHSKASSRYGTYSVPPPSSTQVLHYTGPEVDCSPPPGNLP